MVSTYDAGAKMKNNIVRGYEPGDEATIVPLFKSVFNTERTVEHWYWKFRDNPFGHHKIAQAITGEGVLAAHFGGYPVPFYSSDGEVREFMAIQGVDVWASPNSRNSFALGKDGMLGRATIYFYNEFCIGKTPFVYGFTAEKIRRIGERFLNFQYISNIPCHYIDLDEKGLKNFSVIKRIMSGLSLSIEKVSTITSEYDLFFERVCDYYGTLVKRASSYLKWRYFDCPDKVHSFFEVRRFGKLVGWSTFSRKNNVLIWGDALFDKKHLPDIGHMLAYLRKRWYPDITRIEGWFAPVSNWWSNMLQDIGFEVMDEPQNLAPLFIIFDDRFSAEFFDHNFYYTMGDSDLF